MIRGVIGSVEPEVFTKMLRDLSEKLKLRARVKFARLDDALSDFFEQEASPEEGQSVRKKIEKGEKERRKKKKTEKPKDVGHFLVHTNLISAQAQAEML